MGTGGDRGGARRTGALVLSVGRFFGVPVYFAPSWVIIALLVTVTYAPLVRDVVPGVGRRESFLVAFGYAVAVAVCVLLHELGHTAVSLRLGHPVKRVVIFLLGGISELEGDITRARDEFLVAAAGPGVSAVLAVACGAVAYALPAHTVPWLVLLLLGVSNVVIAGFNLLPGLPLDGGRMVRAAVWRLVRSRLTGTRVAARSGQVIAILVGGGSIVLYEAGYGVSTFVLGGLMGAFIWVGAIQSLRTAELAERLPDLRVATLVRPGLLVTADVSVAEALRRTWESQARGLVVVDSADRPQAIVDELQIRAVPPPQRAWTSVGQVARALEPGLVLPVGMTGSDLMTALQQTPAREYLVVHPDGSPAGILASADLNLALSRG